LCHKCDNWHEILYPARFRLGRLQIKVEEPESENSAPAIAAHICAYGRMRLWELIKMAGPNNTYYVDTDSLIVNAEALHRLQAEMDQTKLGYLKVEGVSSQAEFLAPKHYLFGDEFKVKGIRRNATQRIDTRQYEQDRFTSWAAHLNKDQHGFINVRRILKTVTGENTKRVYNGEGWTLPIEVNE